MTVPTFYFFSSEPPAIFLDWLNSQAGVLGIYAERGTLSLRASSVFQEHLGYAAVWFLEVKGGSFRRLEFPQLRGYAYSLSYARVEALCLCVR